MATEHYDRLETSQDNFTDKGKGLPDKPCRFVILTNQNRDTGGIVEADTGNDGYKTSNNEIIWGYNSGYSHTLYPSQTSILIPCNNAKEINIKTRDGVTRTVYYSIIA